MVQIKPTAIFKIQQATLRLTRANYPERNKKQIATDFKTVRNSRKPMSNLVAELLRDSVKEIVEKIPKNIKEIYLWKREFGRLSKESGEPYLIMIGNCVLNLSDTCPDMTIPESILRYTNSQFELGRINAFNKNTLLKATELYEKELNSFTASLEAEKQSSEVKQTEQEGIPAIPIGTKIPFSGGPQAGREGLAISIILAGDYITHLNSSMNRSSVEQIIQVYSAAGIEEWREDINSLDSRGYSIALIVDKLHSSSDPFVQELKHVCIEVIKANPKLVIQDIVRRLMNNLHKTNLQKSDLIKIRETIQLFQLSGEDLLQAIMKPILDPEKSNSGIQFMNGGTAQCDVKIFLKLMSDLEQVTDYKPDLKQLGKAIFEKALSWFLPKDGMFGMPLTESINYLVILPEEFGLNIEELDFVRRYGQSGWFNTVLITTMNRAIQGGGSLLSRYNPDYMTRFCNKYKEYINFDDPSIITLIDILKARDETESLLAHTVEEILLDNSLGNQLYEQVSKYGSPGNIDLIKSIIKLTGGNPFLTEPQE